MKVIGKLRIVKVIHTAVWMFFAVCIFTIPAFAFAGNFAMSCLLISIVFVEVLILFFNDMRCPLTAVAGRYTDKREANFDIYLPLWLARHNKLMFGGLYVVGVMYTLLQWFFTHATRSFRGYVIFFNTAIANF